MIEGGEDVKFIARRMLILSSEDIGNANPTAYYGQQYFSRQQLVILKVEYY
jgi:replication-associated recombination protein RarA